MVNYARAAVPTLQRRPAFDRSGVLAARGNAQMNLWTEVNSNVMEFRFNV